MLGLILRIWLCQGLVSLFCDDSLWCLSVSRSSIEGGEAETGIARSRERCFRAVSLMMCRLSRL